VLGEGLSRLQPGAYLLNAPFPVNAPFPGERLPQWLLVRWGSCIEHLVAAQLAVWDSDGELPTGV